MKNETNNTKENQMNENPVQTIVRQALAEQKQTLTELINGHNVPPWATAENCEEAIAECTERIASIQARLADSEQLREWWDSIPENERAAMLNA